MKAKDITHIYHEWRQQLNLHHQSMLTRLHQRVCRDGDQAVLSDEQRLIVALAQLLDEGGETTEYIRDLADGE